MWEDHSVYHQWGHRILQHLQKGNGVPHKISLIVLKEFLYSHSKVRHWTKIFASILEEVLAALVWFCLPVNLSLSSSRDNYLDHVTSITCDFHFLSLMLLSCSRNLYCLHLRPYHLRKLTHLFDRFSPMSSLLSFVDLSALGKLPHHLILAFQIFL